MDLSAFKQRDEFSYQLVLPNGDKSDVVFRMAGPTHPIRSALERKTTNRGLRTISKKGKNWSPEDADEMKQNQVDRLVACTLGWEGLVIDGKEVVFSPTAARAIYSDDYYGWVRDNVWAALGDVELFTKGSAASSAPTPSTSSVSD